MINFIEQFFPKALTQQINQKDLEKFLVNKIEESQNLEYKDFFKVFNRKGEINKNDNYDGDKELCKSVAGMANSEGGLIILGIKEKEEKMNGKIIRISPEKITWGPSVVTKEQIERILTSKISYPITGIKILPVRNNDDVVFLLSIPQSVRMPHRVDEKEYYIRRNFETVPMLHFEISDSFGKRLKPDLQLKISKVKGANEDRGHISIKPVIVNLGRNIAKYVTCICVIESPDIKIWQSKWQVREDKKSCQFTITIGNVIHPTMNFETGYIELMPINTDQSIDEASLLFILYAENTEPKKFNFKICK